MHGLRVMASSDHVLMLRMELTEVARKFEVLMYFYSVFYRRPCIEQLDYIILVHSVFTKKLGADLGVK